MKHEEERGMGRRLKQAALRKREAAERERGMACIRRESPCGRQQGSVRGERKQREKA